MPEEIHLPNNENGSWMLKKGKRWFARLKQLFAACAQTTTASIKHSWIIRMTVEENLFRTNVPFVRFGLVFLVCNVKTFAEMLDT